MKTTVTFIIVYDDERCLEECIYYISKLVIPKDVEINVFSILRSERLIDDFNMLLEENKTPYKIYLDQQTLIIHPFFLFEVIQTFQKHPELGMLGVLGTGGLGEDWQGSVLLWEDSGIVKVDQQSGDDLMRISDLSEMLLAVSHNILWRETESHSCYECMEMDMHCSNIQTGIPAQKSSWCVYDARKAELSEFEREYQYLMLRVETLHDTEGLQDIRQLLEEGHISYESHMAFVEKLSFAKVLTGYLWEDFLHIERRNGKYLTADGSIFSDSREKNKMHVAAAFNHQYVVYASVMLQSLFENNTLAEIHVHILQCDLTADDRYGLEKQAEEFGNRIYFYDFPAEWLPKDIQVTREWSKEAYFRLFMTQLLPQSIERVLYLDTDMIVAKPVYDLYFMDMKGREIIACRDFSMVLREGFSDKRKELFEVISDEPEFVYFNSGMMLMDLGQLRNWIQGKDYLMMADKLKGCLLAPDQDILNLVHWKNTGLVDEFRYDLFNACLKGLKAEEAEQYASIIHYAGPKPWMNIDITMHAHSIWWKYASRTKMANSLVINRLCRK